MTQLINNQLEGLISLQKLQTEQSAQAKDFQTAKDTSVNGTNAELKAVADQFEAIFLEMLLKQARDSKLSDGLFDNKADDNFVQLFDQELANEIILRAKNSMKQQEEDISKCQILQSLQS